MKKYYKINNQNFKNNKDIISGVTTDIEFDKWLNYETDEEKNKKKYLLSLDIEKLDNNQIEELKIYNEQDIYSQIINKYTYNIEECTKEECDAAIEYICSHSLDSIINNKIKEEDKKLADNKVTKMFLYMNKRELSDFINSYNNQNFKNINIIDAYIYHQVSVLYNKMIEQEEKVSNNIIKKLFFKKIKASC